MPKSYNENELEKSDLITILEVNKKLVELLVETSSQFEDIISKIEYCEKHISDVKVDIKEKIISDIKEINNNQFKILILLSTGVISLIIQIITMLKH